MGVVQSTENSSMILCREVRRPPGPLGSSVRDLTVSAKLTLCVTHTRTLLHKFAIIKLNASPNEQISPHERG